MHNLRTETLHQQYELVRLLRERVLHELFDLFYQEKDENFNFILYNSYWLLFRSKRYKKYNQKWEVYVLLRSNLSSNDSFCWLLQVKKRTINGNSAYGSHVMQYGDVELSKDSLFAYLGTNPANDNFTFVDENSLVPPTKAVNQRDADLVHFWYKVCVLCPLTLYIKHKNCFFLNLESIIRNWCN